MVERMEFLAAELAEATRPFTSPPLPYAGHRSTDANHSHREGSTRPKAPFGVGHPTRPGFGAPGAKFRALRA